MSNEDYIKAGNIAGKVRELSRKWLYEGVSVAEFADKVENKIIELGCRPAFPVNISFNDSAAHDTARPGDSRIFNKGDVIKIDIGVQVNGFIGDTAYTKEISSNNYAQLIKASEEALSKAISITKLGIELKEIGRTIHNEIKSYGYEPIYNLGGHPLNQYEQHGEFMIPNYDNKSEFKLSEGVIAIEPFATNGSGWVKNATECFIYNLVNIKPTRSITGRKILDFIKKEYNTLPFAERWIADKFSNYKLALMQLIKEGIIHTYPILKEKTGGIVSQTEHTIMLNEEKIVTTEL